MNNQLEAIMLIDDCIKANIQDVCISKNLLQEAQVFVFDDATCKTIRKLTEKVDYKDIQKQFKPPYPVTWVEQYSNGDNYDGSKWAMRFGWLIDYQDEHNYQIYICNGMGEKPTCREMYACIQGDIWLTNITYGGLKNGIPTFHTVESDAMRDENGKKGDMFWPVHAMMLYVFGMNFRELVNIERKEFSKLNKKREKISQLPLKDRNIVTIKLEQKIYSGNASANEDKRNSPRMHLRRGHFMKRNDKVIWRRVALVGSSGFIKKEYKVANV